MNDNKTENRPVYTFDIITKTSNKTGKPYDVIVLNFPHPLQPDAVYPVEIMLPLDKKETIKLLDSLS